MNEDYPVTLAIDYPDRSLSRLTTFFRIFTAIPIWIVLAALGGASVSWGNGRAVAVGTGGLLFLPVLLLILFRKKYPRWWFDWNLQFMRFGTRVGAYLALMDDRYPSSDEEQSVHLELRYPDAERDLARGMPLVKWLLAIPHYIVLLVLYLFALVVVIVAWFAILFTGRYPRAAFEFVEGVLRWHSRVVGYALVLVTDRYPPFRLSP